MTGSSEFLESAMERSRQANWANITERENIIDEHEHIKRRSFLYDLAGELYKQEALPLVAYSVKNEYGSSESKYGGRFYRVGMQIYGNENDGIMFEKNWGPIKYERRGKYIEETSYPGELVLDDLFLPRVMEFVEQSYSPNKLPKVIADKNVTILRMRGNLENKSWRRGIYDDDYHAGTPKNWKDMFPNHLGGGRWWTNITLFGGDIQIYQDGSWHTVEHHSTGMEPHNYGHRKHSRPDDHLMLLGIVS